MKIGKSLSFKSILDDCNTKIYDNVNSALFNGLGIRDWDDIPEGSADMTTIASQYVGRGFSRYIIEKDETWF